MRKIKRHLGKNIGKGTAKIAGLALASVIAAGSAFGVTGVSAMAADDAGITNTHGDGAEEPGEEPTGENQPGTEEPGEEPTGENQPGTEEPGEEQAGEIQPGAEEPTELSRPDIMEEPVLNLIQTEGGTVTAEPFERSSDSYNKYCYISAKADEGWYFKKWDIEFNEDKGDVDTYATNYSRLELYFYAKESYKADSDILTKLTYGTANVSAVFEKLNEGEYVITGLNGSEEENIVARAGEKVTITLSDFDPQSNYDVHYESDDSKIIESEIDPTQKTISFIMPESNVDITGWKVKFQGGSSNVPSEELTSTPGGDTDEESDGTTKNTDEKVKKEDNEKNGTTAVEENNTDNESEAKTDISESETKNTAVSTTAAPVKAGTPVSVYSAPVRNAGSTTAAQTGDKTNAPLWIAVAAGSVVAVLGAFVIRRKKNSEE